MRPCFTGELTPAAADLLLDRGPACRLDPRRIARLRVLLVARAFEAGLGVWDLHALGRALPQLGRVLKADDTDGLARLRLPLGSAVRPTVAAVRAGRDRLRVGEIPDVGRPALGNRSRPVAVPAVAGRRRTGPPARLWPRPDRRRRTDPRLADPKIESKPAARQSWRRLSSCVSAPTPFRCTVTLTLCFEKLLEWGDYFFKEFLPWIGNALTRPDEGATDRLGPLTVRCPECRTAFIGRRGEVGYHLNRNFIPCRHRLRMMTPPDCTLILPPGAAMPRQIRLLALCLVLLGTSAIAEDRPATAGRTSDGFLLPNGWTITPAGRHVVLTDLPLNIHPLSDGRSALVATSGYNKHELSLVDLADGTVTARATVRQSWFGLATDRSRTAIWWSGGGGNLVHHFDLTGDRLSPHRAARTGSRAR